MFLTTKPTLHRPRSVRRAIILLILAVLMIPNSVSRAEDEPKPEQLKQLYENTLSQLKSAQERKTQLAEENEQLKAKIAELEKQMKAVGDKNAEMKKQTEAFAERSFFLRSHYAAWQEFIRRYPKMQIRWRVFLESDLMTPQNDMRQYVDPDWPWSANG